MNILISSTLKEDKKEVIKLAQSLNAGIEICDFIEISVLDNYYNETLKLYNQNLKDFDGVITIHSPFFDLNNIAFEQTVKDFTLYRYNQCFDAAKALNAKTIVFHTGYNSLLKVSFYDDYFLESQASFWKEYIKSFEDADITATLENTYESNPELLTRIIDEVNSPYLKLCLDIGHINVYSDIPVDGWITKSANRLHHMHLHNNSGMQDDHNPFHKGTLDISKIVETLIQEKLSPDLSLEIFDVDSTIEGVNLLETCISPFKGTYL